MFDLSRIASAGLVARVDYNESVGSTSDRALAIGASGETEMPLLVLAARQTAGRGRGTNRWWTSEGALTFSLLLEAPRERLPPSEWPRVALISGLAICEALGRLTPAGELRVKWPNDVYLNGRKIAGVLSESVPGWQDRLVVGVGLNVNNRVQTPCASGQRTGANGQEADAGSTDLGRSAVSLIEYDGVRRDLTVVLLAVLDEFDRRWTGLLEAQFEEAAGDFQKRCFLTGKTVTVEQPGKRTIVGRCRGIDAGGRLLVQTEAGTEAVFSGTVARWDDSG